MRIALLSDIHGNTIALESVLADISAKGRVDAYWILGDLVALGPDPIGVMERLAKLPGLQYTSPFRTAVEWHSSYQSRSSQFIAFCKPDGQLCHLAGNNEKL